MIFADLHVHIGQSLDGKAVKITASKTLTLPNIVKVARDIKGLNLLGVVDAHSTGVRQDFKTLISAGDLRPLSAGGYAAHGLTLIPGHEIELRVGKGNAHLLAFFPSIEQMSQYILTLRPSTKNWQLSTQKGTVSFEQWCEAVERAEGIWLPAHAFTPHKGIYGNCCQSLHEVLSILPKALEIGLSADRAMAACIGELDPMILFSNSDAHSLPNIAREYNMIDQTDPSYAGLCTLLRGTNKPTMRNYGLPPKIGKYHRTYCLNCEKIVTAPAPQLVCPDCGGEHVVLGVLDRLLSIADRPLAQDKNSLYVYQVPLRQLPGVGSKMYERLLKAFGTEIAVLHHVDQNNLQSVAGEKVARLIMKAREGKLELKAGGGGVFGRVVDILSELKE